MASIPDLSALKNELLQRVSAEDGFAGIGLGKDTVGPLLIVYSNGNHDSLAQMQSRLPCTMHGVRVVARRRGRTKFLSR